MSDQSRAVVRQIEPGGMIPCTACGETVKFVAKHTQTQRRKVIANVYEGGKWQRVEHYHLACYEQADMPYGAPTIDKKLPSGKPTGTAPA